MHFWNVRHADNTMNWNNIEIDHIKPIATIGKGDPIDESLLHFTNLQPLLKKDNRDKSAKWSAADDAFWTKSITMHAEYVDIYIPDPSHVYPRLAPESLYVKTCTTDDEGERWAQKEWDLERVIQELRQQVQELNREGARAASSDKAGGRAAGETQKSKQSIEDQTLERIQEMGGFAKEHGSDGNCFYRCMADVLLGDARLHGQVRATVVGHLRENVG